MPRKPRSVYSGPLNERICQYDPENFPSRNFVPDAHRRYVGLLLDRLATLEAGSHPDGGKATAEGKDFNAFDALQVAGKLVQAVAGWAIDHQVGLAIQGLHFVPLQPSQTRKHPQYLAARAAVDDHNHEHAGGRLLRKRVKYFPPKLARQILENLIRCNPGGFPWVLWHQVLQSLEGLPFGEDAEMFQPENTGRKATLSRMRLEIKALAMVEYRFRRGTKKYVAQEQVANALHVNGETLRGWEYKLRNDPAIGGLEVARGLAFAGNAASHGPGSDNFSHFESQYGEEALRELGVQYRRRPSRRRRVRS